jgi:cytochrome c-type biogenesis protein CcmE
MKFKYLVIVLAVGCLVLLYLLSLYSQPTTIALSSLPEHEGQQVIVLGVVTDQRTTASGSQIISIKDSENSSGAIITLFIEGETQVDYGDIIQATGVVQQYKNEWELVVNNPRYVIILQKWNSSVMALWQLAENPDKYLDTNVNVTGVAGQGSKSSFSLIDSREKYSIMVYYESSCPHLFSQGDTVAVGARFVYDDATFQFVLHATENNHGIWRLER